MRTVHAASFDSDGVPLCGKATQDLEIVSQRQFERTDALDRCWECAAILGCEEDQLA
jgi:hypothetical protein